MFNCKIFTETNPTSILSIWQNQVNLLRRLKRPVGSFLPLSIIKIASHKRTGGRHATPRMGMDGELIIADWRSLDQAQWAPDGFAAISTAALDPPHSAESPAVPALHGAGSPLMASQASRVRRVVSTDWHLEMGITADFVL